MTNEQAPSDAGARQGKPKKTRQFDLVERTARLGETVIGLVRGIRLDAVTSPVIKQLVRAAASVGANYCEADEAGSKKEFRYRISVCNRESRETKHWLRMLAAAVPSKKGVSRLVWKEANELNLIFSSIYRKTEASDRSSSH